MQTPAHSKFSFHGFKLQTAKEDWTFPQIYRVSFFFFSSQEHMNCHVKVMQLFISRCCSPSCCWLVLSWLNSEHGDLLNELMFCICLWTGKLKRHPRHQLCRRGCQDSRREPPSDARAEREGGAAPGTEGGRREVSLLLPPPHPHPREQMAHNICLFTLNNGDAVFRSSALQGIAACI